MLDWKTELPQKTRTKPVKARSVYAYCCKLTFTQQMKGASVEESYCTKHEMARGKDENSSLGEKALVHEMLDRRES